MKRKWLTYFIALPLTILAGCSGGEENPPPILRDEVTIPGDNMLLSGPVMSELGVTQTDLTNIQILRVDGTPANFANATLSASGAIKAGSTTMAFTPRQFFKASHDDVHLFAYYPRTEDISLGNPIKVGYVIDGTQDILVSQSVVSVEYPTGQTANAGFVFGHELALLKLSIVASDAGTASRFGAVDHVKLKGWNNLQLTVAGNGSKTFGRNPSVTAKAEMSFPSPVMYVAGGAERSSYMMVYPMWDSSDTDGVSELKVKFRNLSEHTYTIDWPGTFSGLEAGKVYNVTLNVTAYEITFSVDVEPWTTDFTKEINIGGGAL